LDLGGLNFFSLRGAVPPSTPPWDGIFCEQTSIAYIGINLGPLSCTLSPFAMKSRTTFSLTLFQNRNLYWT
jgi:hypothetical protein